MRLLTVINVLVCLQACFVSYSSARASIGGHSNGHRSRRTCVVGAGVAGLVTAQQLLEAGQQVSVLEATAHVGGTWYYEPRVGTDEYGRAVHTSQYKYLRANVPRQLLELPGLPIPPETATFPNGTTYYQYLQNYTRHFNLSQHIEFLREVVLVSRKSDVWRVEYKDAVTGRHFVQYFDNVIICVGHFNKPRYPNIPREEWFTGSIIHSHDYREPEPYTDRRVLIIGAGPSALDLVTTLTRYCRRVVHSHHSKSVNTPFPDNYIHRPDVARFTRKGVLFNDGSFEEVDDVIYATGYQFNFPFLGENVGLISGPQQVAALHNHVVNIIQPTMLWVGLVYSNCAVITIVMQAQYAAAIVSGRAALPSRFAMYRGWLDHASDIEARGGRPSELHTVPDDRKYFSTITTEGNLPPVPPVLVELCAADLEALVDNFYTFRNYDYTVLDDRRFVRVCPPGNSCSSDSTL